MKAVRKIFQDPRAVDAVVVVVMTCFIFSAYLDAYAYVRVPSKVLTQTDQAAQAGLAASWYVLTAFLFFLFGRGLRLGRPWNRALPDGYTGSLAAALVFGAALIIDNNYWSFATPNNPLGLDRLFTPPHVVMLAAAAVMVSGPLRAAARRGDSTAGIVTLLSAALLLSVFTFATQFIHPLIDLWSADPTRLPANVDRWVAQNLGVSALLVQSTILAVTGLLLNSSFRLRPGSLTLVFIVNGMFVLLTKSHYELLPAAAVAGIAGDAWLLWSSRRTGRPSASLCAVIAGAYTAAYMIDMEILGTAWSPSLWVGVVLAAVAISWMIGRLLRAGLPGSVEAPPVQLAGVALEVRWTRDPQSTIRPQLVRAALDDLGTPEALGRSPLGQLPGVARGGSVATDLRAVLVDVIGEVATSRNPRDAEAGKVMLDYYVKKVGSHEVIMERLHLTHPTYYRRLQKGFALVAERLDEMSEFAQRLPLHDGPAV
ncbi:MAG: hypothetical protein PVS2B1_09010 [Candidatus Dormibacteraceae bacterium]